MRGAGGTEGGIAKFLVGFAMIIGGGYLFFDAVRVTSGFRWGHGLYHFGGFGITTGMILVPFIFGVVFIFYRADHFLGWLLALGSLLALLFGILRSLQFHLISMSAFDLILILVLLFGGVGLFASSLRDHARA